MSRPLTPKRKASEYAADVGSLRKEEEVEVDARVRAHLRHQMHVRKINEAELARRLKTSQAVISRFMSGKTALRVWLAIRICRKLGFTATHLLEEDAPEQYRDEHQPAENGGATKKK